MTKTPFKTQYSVRVEKKSYRAPAGNHIEMRHNPYMLSNGRRELRKDKAVAIHELIQSHKEECEIENIIRRYVEGDLQVLQQRYGQFMDITNCPSSIADAQQFIINAKEEFTHLPKEIKAKFEYNPELYIAEMSTNTESWLNKVGLKDKFELQKQAGEQAIKDEETFRQAMTNLAQGNTITNTEVKSNE